ncbi:hypothetical protein CKO14_02895 [Halorhodospira halophila]|nr:hypothetical protein [Halorhodospira halophila]
MASAAALTVGFISGCSTSTSFVNYDEREMYSGETAGNIQFVEIGGVQARANGFVWESCGDLTSEAADELREEARQVGGNAVINVRWLGGDEGGRQPICTTGWGWFALGGVGGLHPWVKNAGVGGVAVFADEDELHALRDAVADKRALLVEEEEEVDEEDWQDDSEVDDEAAEEDVDAEDEGGDEGDMDDGLDFESDEDGDEEEEGEDE